MYLKVSARFTFKDRPKDYRGLTSEFWTFGHKGALSLAEMCIAILNRVFDYYCYLEDGPQTLNSELDAVREWLEGHSFSEPAEKEE